MWRCFYITAKSIQIFKFKLFKYSKSTTRFKVRRSSEDKFSNASWSMSTFSIRRNRQLRHFIFTPPMCKKCFRMAPVLYILTSVWVQRTKLGYQQFFSCFLPVLTRTWCKNDKKWGKNAFLGLFHASWHRNLSTILKNWCKHVLDMKIGKYTFHMFYISVHLFFITLCF